MEYKIRRKLEIDFVLGSSELIMMNQGGKQKIELNSGCFQGGDSWDWNCIEVYLQLNREEQGRHDHVIKSAAQHLNNLTPEDIAARERDKKRFEELRLKLHPIADEKEADEEEDDE
jgi:hypothetical protein